MDTIENLFAFSITTRPSDWELDFIIVSVLTWIYASVTPISILVNSDNLSANWANGPHKVIPSSNKSRKVRQQCTCDLNQKSTGVPNLNWPDSFRFHQCVVCTESPYMALPRRPPISKLNKTEWLCLRCFFIIIPKTVISKVTSLGQSKIRNRQAQDNSIYIIRFWVQCGTDCAATWPTYYPPTTV